MPNSEQRNPEALFDLNALCQEMRLLEAYQRVSRAARTLLHETDLRIVLVVMAADGRIAEHHAEGSVAIQVLTGNLRVRLPTQIIEAAAGSLLHIDKGIQHSIETAHESAFLLTLGK